MKVLVTGIAGNIGRLVAKELVSRGYQVIGIDRRAWDDPPEGVLVYQHDIRKRPAEDVFRTQRPQALIHLATVTHVTARVSERYRINLGGTRTVFEHCHTYGVERAIFVGRHTYYGATSDAPLYHTEDEPPIAMQSFPELSDLVAADLYAGSALWRFPDVATAVLRLCYTLGPLRQGTLASYLRGPRVPTVMGFDPIYQFIHENDAAKAIATALETPGLRGIYNVAGPPPVPLSIIIRETGRQNLALPEFMLGIALGRLGLPKLASGAISHLKWPVVIDDAPFRNKTGFVHTYDEDETMQAFRTASKLAEQASR